MIIPVPAARNTHNAIQIKNAVSWRFFWNVTKNARFFEIPFVEYIENRIQDTECLLFMIYDCRSIRIRSGQVYDFFG
jgi:hypothetical protein